MRTPFGQSGGLRGFGFFRFDGESRPAYLPLWDRPVIDF
jgi:hypothetical protein